MALSSTFYTDYGTYLRIQGEWTATQDYSANTSTVTLRTYWIDRGSSTGIYSSSSKSGNSVIEGTSDSFTATAGLSPNQKKLINTQTRVISHNSDGTFSGLDLSVTFNPQITFAGTYYGTVTSSGTYTLNTIPRESTLSSAPSYTAGNNFTISVNRASSSFSHEAEIYLQNEGGTWGPAIKTVSFTTSQTSKSSSYTTTEITEIFNKLNGRSSAPSRIILRTYSGATLIGSTQRDGTTTAPYASHPTTGYDAYWYVDESPVIPITRGNGAFTHTVRFILGTYTKTFTGVTNNVTWNPTAGERTSMYNQMPNDNFMNGTIEVDTFYNGEPVRTTTTHFIQFHVRNSDPIFSGEVTYADVNSSTTTITGNDQYIISGQSTLHVTLPSTSSATAQNGATMSGYVATVAGEGITVPYSTATQTFNFGTIDASTNQTINVAATDSRGNKTTISKIVLVVPYSAPNIIGDAKRVNGFEAETDLTASATFSPVKVAGVAKNYTSLFRYRTREKGGVWSSYVTLANNTVFNTTTATPVQVLFDITKAYEVEFNIYDRFGGTAVMKSVGVGRPILFIDDILGSMAMNDFPVDPGTFLLNGRLSFAGNIYASSGEGAVGGAIDLNNGDIVRANGIWFSDLSNNSGEGLLFARSNTPANSTNSADYDNFYIRDKELYLNDASYMQFVPFDSAGNGLRLGAGGLTIIGAGESSQELLANVPFTAGAEEMFIGSDNDVYISTNLQNGYASRKDFIFGEDGYFYKPHYIEKNGGQMATIYNATFTPDPYMIQHRAGTFSVTNQSFVDVTWSVAFDSTPLWVVAVGTGSNSVAFNMTAYDVTTTGCRVYAKHVDSNAGTFSVDYRIIACGRKS